MTLCRRLRIAAWFVFMACAPGCTDSAASKPAEPADTVELKIVDFDGILREVAAHRGKIVVMDAWSTQCEPCMQEFPKLVALHQRYPDQVACVSLSFDYEGLGKPEDVRGKVLEFLRSQRALFDNLLCSEPSDDLYAKLKLAAVPAVFIYDQHGELAQRFDSTKGKFTYQDVEAKVKEMMK
jgi:thiol-disulfide isomerase/thioredoxin